MRANRLVLAASLVALAPLAAWGQTSYPMITHTHPVAVQRGKTTEVTVEGQQNFLGAYKVLVEGEKVLAAVVPAAPPKPQPPQKPVVRSVKLTVTPAADALPGVREFRIATRHSLSSVGQLLIVDDPVIIETANNNTRAAATPVTVPCVACGKIEAVEDVDYYKFRAEAGQVVTFEVHCARLQDKIHDLQKHGDPLIRVLDAGGKELAASDDYYFADPLLSHRFESAGEYFVEVRDARYDGDPRWVYALTITTRPYASHVYPLAVRPGQTVEVEPVGPARLVHPKAKLTVPADAPPGVRLVQPEVAGQRTNPVAVLVSPLPQVIEQEPNDNPAQATPLAVPGCANGRIGVKRDLDHYRFTAKKGQAVRFEVKARRFGTDLVSGVDASLDVLDLKGGVLASADDISPAIKDAQLVFTPPADGEYIIRVRDLLSKGGEHFVYALEAEPVAPDFTLRCDGDKAMLGPGSSMAWYVHVTRLDGFTGPVAVEVKGLPPGVTASPLVIPPSMTQGVLVLTADASAAVDAVPVVVVGRAVVKGADGKERVLERPATANQEIYFPGGGRGRFDVNLHAVGVTEPSDVVRVEVNPPVLTLRPGEEVKIDVTIHRRPDFDGNVQLDVKLRHLNQVYGDPLPPGVTVVEAKSKTLLGKGNQGHIVLRAAPDAAPVENVPISVLAQVSINFVVKISYSSPPIPVTITAPNK
jgi:hypothetical protein